ncbi:6-phosphofructokinase [Pseudobacteriovorax antillogorgiicola]|uniref:ATP-dependent 6-phosphofructokinase n=1 Tax=Pseudobacteriovorax antillogorgiicola TaxID=1513793 RepID=A0A1Y6CBJ2_9BACT|nr:ATP-dependent 6-phosphofructokinase [Pseudobacteriovorax antillogorgiicola]TCS48640.1 6-phosphofructokinase 1 [Pseudobacteriovorax antillogorgiicola]SMF55287.1 6-phosphofructokinase 1 [Pseudobacteriovorax antillogorgiicola]
MKVGICTGGGDCPGLNSIIRAVVRHAAQFENVELWGIKDSFNGLMSEPYGVRKLDCETVSGILMKGGTILGTTNAGNPFSLKNPGGGDPEDKSQKVIKAYQELNLDGVIVIGGDGTQGIAYELAKLGMNIVGVPKTIDNDLASTDQTVGFDTAVEVAAEAIARLQTTAESHERAMVLEVMGRNAGHIALHSGIASGAHVILLPEIPFSYEAIIQKLDERKQRGKHHSVIVVAEGAYPKGGEESFKVSSGRKNLGGVGHMVAEELFQRTNIETRVTVLGHIQRGGVPSHVDRALGTAYGVKAMDLVMEKKFGTIIALKGGRLTEIDYQDVAGKFRPVPADDLYLQAAKGVGICLGQ